MLKVHIPDSHITDSHIPHPTSQTPDLIPDVDPTQPSPTQHSPAQRSPAQRSPAKPSTPTSTKIPYTKPCGFVFPLTQRGRKGMPLFLIFNF